MLKFCHGGSGRRTKFSVNPGSKAAQKGIREGDVISSINGQSTRNITNSDAHALLRNAGQTLHLGLNEECSGSPKRRLHRNIQPDSKSDCVKRSSLCKTTTVRTSNASVNGSADPNCNNQFSTRGDGQQGKQNGGVKENSTPDSKGANKRRRRRSTSQQGEAMEDSDIVPTEGGTTSSQKKKKSRGRNRRKVRSGLSADSEVSGNEQKIVCPNASESETVTSDVGRRSDDSFVEEQKKDSRAEASGKKSKSKSRKRRNSSSNKANKIMEGSSEREDCETVTKKVVVSSNGNDGRALGAENKTEVSAEREDSNALENVCETIISMENSSSVVKFEANYSDSTLVVSNSITAHESEFMSEVVGEITKNKTEFGEFERKVQISSAIVEEDISAQGRKEETQSSSIEPSDAHRNISEQNKDILSDSKPAEGNLGVHLENTQEYQVEVTLKRDIKYARDLDFNGDGSVPEICESCCENNNTVAESVAITENTSATEGVTPDLNVSSVTRVASEITENSSCSLESHFSVSMSETNEDAVEGNGNTTNFIEGILVQDMIEKEIDKNKKEDTENASSKIFLTTDGASIQEEDKGIEDKSEVIINTSLKIEESIENSTNVMEQNGKLVDCATTVTNIGEETNESDNNGSVENLETSSNVTCRYDNLDLSEEKDVSGTKESQKESNQEYEHSVEICADVEESMDSEKLIEDKLNEEAHYMSNDESQEKKGSTSNALVTLLKANEVSLSEGNMMECSAVVIDASYEEVWEEVEEFLEPEMFYDANERLSENAASDEMEDGFLLATNTTAFLHDSELSAEDKELLDTSSVMNAEEEDSLRTFLHSLDLADYRKEAVSARDAEEAQSSKREKRRASLETVLPAYSQQRGLEVIVEENSSDYSDGEKRCEEAKSVRKERKGNAWENAIYLPETNEIIYVNADSDEGETETQDTAQNRASFIRETTVISDTKTSSYVTYSKTNCDARFMQFLSQDAGTDMLSEDMENALESAMGCEEIDSEGSKRDGLTSGEEGRVELVDTSEEDDPVDGPWKVERAPQRQSGVEIVYLEEDSGSTSSGMKCAEDDAADDADGEYDVPDVSFGAAFAVTKCNSEGEDNDSSSGIYENVEFLNQKIVAKKTFSKSDKLTEEKCRSPAAYEKPVITTDDTSAVYENVVYVKREKESSVCTQKEDLSSVTSHVDNIHDIPPMSDSNRECDVDISNSESNTVSQKKANNNNCNMTSVQNLQDLSEKYTEESVKKASISEDQGSNLNSFPLKREVNTTSDPSSTVQRQNESITVASERKTAQIVGLSSVSIVLKHEDDGYTNSRGDNYGYTISSDERGIDCAKSISPVASQEEHKQEINNTNISMSALKVDHKKEAPDDDLSLEAIENDANRVDAQLDDTAIIVSEVDLIENNIQLTVLEYSNTYNSNIISHLTGMNCKTEANILYNTEKQELYCLEDLESVTPTNRSRHESSSSDAGSHGTAFYCPSGFSPLSSDADTSSIADDGDGNSTLRRKHLRSKIPRSRSQENIDSKKPNIKTVKKHTNKSLVTPKTLRDLCTEKVMSLNGGTDILRILGIPTISKTAGNDSSISIGMKDSERRLQTVKLPPISAALKCMGKPPLSGSLPDLSSVKLETPLKGGVDHQHEPDMQANEVNLPSTSQITESSQSLSGSQWLGMPTKEDPNIFICLSPSQKQSYHQGEDPTPEEADNLLDLHRKFLKRRSYNEPAPPPPPNRQFYGIRHCYNPQHLANKEHALSSEQNIVQPETSINIIPSPRFRAVLASLQSKIHTGEVIGGLEDVGEKRELVEDKVEEKREQGEGSGGCSRSRSSSRLLAILRAASSDLSNNVEFQPLSSSSSAANSPPPLPPLPHVYQEQVDMLSFLHQQGKRPSTICCTTYDDSEYISHSQQSSNCINKTSDDNKNKATDWQYQHEYPLSPKLKRKHGEGNVEKMPPLPSQNGRSKNERIQSWCGEDTNEKNNRERLKVRSLSDWLQLVRCGSSSDDTDGIRSKDFTPPFSASLSTQSSPGPTRRVTEVNNNSTKEKNDVIEHHVLKQQIIARRYSLPEKQTEEEVQNSFVQVIKTPVLPTSPREDERHDQQLKLLHQRQQQRLRSQQQSLKMQQEQQQQEQLKQEQQEQKQQTQVDQSPLSQNPSYRQTLVKELQNNAVFNNKSEDDEKQQTSNVESPQNERRFDAENYTISKNRDIAINKNDVNSRIVSSKEYEESIKEQIRKFQEHRMSQRPKSMPPPPTEALVTGGEFFRQQMYVEYMNKVAERAERRRQKVIRLSTVTRDEDVKQSESNHMLESAPSAQQLENEFMGKVRERMDKLGLNYDEESDDGAQKNGPPADCDTKGGPNQLPRHLQEFLVIAGGAGTDSDINSDVDGVWSPSQKASSDPPTENKAKEHQEKKDKSSDDAPPVVWTPKSAGASPTSERKEFRPVNFESPKLQRKNRSATTTPTPTRPDTLQQKSSVTSSTNIQESTTTQESTTSTTFSSAFPPWQQYPSLQHQHSRDDSTVSVGSTIQSPTSEKSVASSTISSTIDRRLVQSQSAPASGLSSLASGGSTSVKLPRAQNPTITLLQKAREGQLPRGALYLDHKMNSKECDKPYISPNEVLYSVKKEYESDGDAESRKKIVELGPRKFEGIGPTTRDGIPIVLRSEVKDTNQAKWYKRMYDSLHRAGKDDDYVTIRYKPRRGLQQRDSCLRRLSSLSRRLLCKQEFFFKRVDYEVPHRDANCQSHFTYTAPGGYLSEPEPFCYDSDIGYSAKYATLDRRRIKNKENDFTTSTLPRSRYVPHPSSIKYATEVYKNQPGRIEDYEPGRSSISEKETKQWWDEVLDIFDGWLESHSPHQHHPNYRSSSDASYQRQASAEPQTTPATPSNKSFMNYALKESGYESDSTLVFRRRDENQSELSPAEHKIAYKSIQKGGEVPLHGLRKPAPERPKDISQVEYFPISPHLTRIRVHKQNITPLREIMCYPVTTTYTNVPAVFSAYKRTAPSYVQVTPKKEPTQPSPPSPPRRQSSHHSSTLRLWSKMRLPSETRTNPIRSRHESCFAGSNVSFLRDRLSHKFNLNKGDTIRGSTRLTRTSSSSPVGARTRGVMPCYSMIHRSKSAPGDIVTAKPRAPLPFSEHRSRKSQQEGTRKLSRSPDLSSPSEVRKILQKQKDVRERLGSRSLPPGTVIRSSTTMYSSARNAGRLCHPEDKALRVTVAMSAKGRELLHPKTDILSTATSTLTTSVPLADTKLSKSPTPSASPTPGSQRGSSSPRLRSEIARSASPCHHSPSSSSCTSKTKALLSPIPSLPSTPLKRASRSASRECVRTPSTSLLLLTSDEGNRRIKKSSADTKKKSKEKSVVPSTKISLSVSKTTTKTTNNGSKGSEKEDKDLNKKKARKPKTDSNGEPKRSQALKKNGVPSKTSSSNKSKVNVEEKRKNRIDKKVVSVPRVETVTDLTLVSADEELTKGRDDTQDVAVTNPQPIAPIAPINLDSFFQNLLLRDIPSPTPSMASSLFRSSSVLEKARKFHEYITGNSPSKVHASESTLGLLNVYLAQKRPVTDSKFRSLDRELSLSSRSPSPTYRSVTFPVASHVSHFRDNILRHEAGSGMFYSLAPSRSRSPEYNERSCLKMRSSSEPPALSPNTGTITRSHSSRAGTPSSVRGHSPPLSPTRSPACRKIHGTRSQSVRTVESVTGLKRRGIRARSVGDADDKKRSLRTPPLSQAQSTSSLNLTHIADHNEYQTYVMELMHSTKKSQRFKELHKFYSSLERLGQLERTTSTGDLRPRLKGEEIIDYDRWMQLRKKEKAEEEMKVLYRKLKEDQKEKDLLFQPKDAESIKWKSDRDRGLRCKEKSVENLKYQFCKLSSEESDLEAAKRKDIEANKDVYKPLWRGSSVLNLATCLGSVTGSRRGRPVVGDRSQSSSRSLSRHSSSRSARGIGSSLWSSLSMDEVNALKSQLNEIYSTVSTLKREKFMKKEDYEISVPPERGKTSKTKGAEDKEQLHVRCNSLVTRDQLYSPMIKRKESRRTESMKADSISSLPHWKRSENNCKSKSEVIRSFSDRVPPPKPMTESEKKRLSMSLSQEVLDRATKKWRKTSAPVVRARETRGAIAAAAAKGKKKPPSPSSSPVLSETISPRTCYSLEMSEEDTSASRKNDFVLVLTPSDDSQKRHHEVQKVMEEWANGKSLTAYSTGANQKPENSVVARLVRTTSASETESASSDASTRTVIHRGDSKDAVLHRVHYFERRKGISSKSQTTDRVCRSASDIRPPSHPALTHSSRAKSAPSAFSTAVTHPSTVPPAVPPSPTNLRPSQSYTDLKELFGEQSRLKYATVPLMTRRRQESESPCHKTSVDQRSRQSSVSPYRAHYSSSSTESVFPYRSRSTSPDPTKYWRAYLRMVKHGDVRRLREKFESLEDIYGYSTGSYVKKRPWFLLKRYRSDPEIARDFLARQGTDTQKVIVRGQEIGDVRRLRHRYETCTSRGRSRGHRSRALSPVLRSPLRAEDRFMPHINVISKTAALQSRSGAVSPQRQTGYLGDESVTGGVKRIRDKFESELSLMGQMFTSTPDVHELKDIAPYLGCHWVAHRFPQTQPNSRSLSSPELRPAPPLPSQSRSPSRQSRPRPASSSPTRSHRQPLSILKSEQSLQQHQMPPATVSTYSVPTGRDVFANQAFDPSIHRPLYRYQPVDSNISSGHRHPARNTGSNWWWRQTASSPSSSRPTVTFKEPVYGPEPPRGHSPRERALPESPHRYVESEVTIHYRSPVRSEAKEALSEEELARRQAEAMRRIYQEERRRKYLQELQDMHSRRHTDNFTPSQKSPIPLNRYDDFLDDVGGKSKSRDRTPEPKLVARALYNFVGQTSRELSFRRGDIIFVRRQIDKNWYEGEHNAMVGLFPFNYVEIIPYDGIRTIPKRPSEGQARAKFNFIAQTHLELSLVKGELLVLTRRVDDNWFEGRIGNRKGIFPVSYVEILSEPGEKPVTPVTPSSKPITLPASHTVLVNGSGIKQSMGQHSYQPSSYYGTNKMSSSYTSSNPYATLPRQTLKQPLAPVNQTLHIDTHSEPVPYRALYNYRPQNEDELELCEGDTVYVMEKCDDGWYVGSSQRTGYFGTFPGNYVERI